MSYIINCDSSFVNVKLTEKGGEMLTFIFFMVFINIGYSNNLNYMSEKLTKENFIDKAIGVHGSKYDYSLVDYKNNKTKIKIICPIHGEFEQTPNSHLSGINCPKCYNTKKTNGEFIMEAKIIHGDKYDYSLVDYKNNKTKVKIICPIHGEFEQVPTTHLRNIGCSKCSGMNKKTNEEFIMETKIIHGDKYDYSLVDYKNANKKIIIICPKHGEFKQTPNHHLKGNGCPICREPKGEKQIRVSLENNKINFIQQKTFDKCKDIRLLPFDFYLPDFNICIEYDGKQHFMVIKRWGGISGLKDQQKKDKIKDLFCLDNNIKLFRINYLENIDEKMNFLYNKIINS